MNHRLAAAVLSAHRIPLVADASMERGRLVSIAPSPTVYIHPSDLAHLVVEMEAKTERDRINGHARVRYLERRAHHRRTSMKWPLSLKEVWR